MKNKTILVTGATDGIGLETVKMLVNMGHKVLVHGRSAEKITQTTEELSRQSQSGSIEGYRADLSSMKEVEALAENVAKHHSKLDVLINNAGVYTTSLPITTDGLDPRFGVNTIAPYLLTKRLLPLFDHLARVVNVASAAQFPVEPDGLATSGRLSDGAAYAQSKLALIMWSHAIATELNSTGPAIISVNPRSMLGSKMVKQAYGVKGGDLRIGGDILCRAALSDEFSTASGRYYDNDVEQFASPHPDALDPEKCRSICESIERILTGLKK